MEKASLCFRFDVDTIRCIREGVPRLLALGKKHDVRFTFFFNMGRAIHRGLLLKKTIYRSHESLPSRAPKLSNFQKLGMRDFLATLLRNPAVGRNHPKTIRYALAAGHEVGLHGGRNHAAWQMEAAAWSSDRLEEELAWGKAELEKIIQNSVRSFSSPGWNSPPALPSLLARSGFRIQADLHGPKAEVRPAFPNACPLGLPTQLTGEPGGVGYLETLAAEGLTQAQALNRFRKDMARHPRFAVAYDHPAFAGTAGMGLLESMIIETKRNGTRIATLEEISDRIRETP